MKYIKLLSLLCLIISVPFFFGFVAKSKVFRQNDSAVNLIVKLDNIEAGTVTVSQLANVNTVNAAVINATDGTPIDYTINSFTLAISQVKDTKEIIRYSEDATGNNLTRTMKAKIAALQPGDIITIKNLKATSPQNASVTYGNTVWQVVANPASKQK